MAVSESLLYLSKCMAVREGLPCHLFLADESTESFKTCSVKGLLSDVRLQVQAQCGRTEASVQEISIHQEAMGVTSAVKVKGMVGVVFYTS